uniref:Uncharacterized protein n=1 Tax=Anguilla anguilla TaxID=7936 RepID=A0A0E9T1U4_ANGAN
MGSLFSLKIQDVSLMQYLKGNRKAWTFTVFGVMVIEPGL